jgi:hypothetical protein
MRVLRSVSTAGLRVGQRLWFVGTVCHRFTPYPTRRAILVSRQRVSLPTGICRQAVAKHCGPDAAASLAVCLSTVLILPSWPTASPCSSTQPLQSSCQTSSVLLHTWAAPCAQPLPCFCDPSAAPDTLSIATSALALFPALLSHPQRCAANARLRSAPVHPFPPGSHLGCRSCWHISARGFEAEQEGNLLSRAAKSPPSQRVRLRSGPPG